MVPDMYEAPNKSLLIKSSKHRLIAEGKGDEWDFNEVTLRMAENRKRVLGELLSVWPLVAQMCEMPVNTTEKPWTVSPEEERERRDLRKTHLVFSIDPKGCEDVDDTLSVRTLNDGDLELGVHIADVTHFVKPNSCIDIEARTR